MIAGFFHTDEKMPSPLMMMMVGEYDGLFFLAAQQKLDYSIAAGMQFTVGDRCQVSGFLHSCLNCRSGVPFTVLLHAGSSGEQWAELRRHGQRGSFRRRHCDGGHRGAGEEVGDLATAPPWWRFGGLIMFVFTQAVHRSCVESPPPQQGGQLENRLPPRQEAEQRARR